MNTTPAPETAAALAAILATIPAAELKIYGLENTDRHLRIKNYWTQQTITIAAAADIVALQPAAKAALRIMATARATAAETLRKEATKHEQKKPARRSPQVDSESNRHPHPAERQQPSSLSASSRP